ncbi:MAG: hypothetical protein K1X87_03255 [Dehalococcoidia bacterium]|nr:hypothetical protein [Dehalococcoidia bacterium]
MASMPAASSELVPFALTLDDEAAERWAAALEREGIEAELRIEDGRALNSGSSVFPTGPIFATALYVPASQRERAAAVLIDLGWDGRQLGAGHRRGLGDRRTALMGAVLMALLVAAIALLRGR